jgi:pectate lyase
MWKVIALLLISSQAFGAAFPGAEGGGALSVGGRNGVVIDVTNLNNSGPGSLRQCAEVDTRPRTCVFRVGGSIHLSTPIAIRNPYITIAGQTAPGGGIQLESKGVASVLLNSSAHDVIISYIKLRKGHAASCTYASQSCGTNLGIWGGYNIIADHLSLAWSMDDSVNYWGAMRDTTFQNSIVAEGLAIQSTAFNIGNGAGANVDIHHNLLMSFHLRIPEYQGVSSSRLVNNIFYNNEVLNTQLLTGTGSKIDAIGNVFKRGPLSQTATNKSPEFVGSGKTSLYLLSNIGYHQTNPAGDQWKMAFVGKYNDYTTGPWPTSARRTTPLTKTFVPIVTTSTDGLIVGLISTVGASRRLDCAGGWVMNRDSVDARLVNQVLANTGNKTIIANEGQVGGYPVLAKGTPCADSDKDGMPNEWEIGHKLNPNNAADRNTMSSNGYRNLENYLAGL